ncbi:hypothetical protein Agub_g3881, partial [Astrephomene gubernaculifera]
ARQGEGFSSLCCMLGGSLMQGCLSVRWYFSGGLLAPEFDHFLDQFVFKGKQRPDLTVATVVTTDLLINRSPTCSTGSCMPGSSGPWDVADLAATLMEKFGGPGSCLFHPKLLAKTHGSVSMQQQQQPRPKLLLLPEVPKLSDKLGPRDVLYREHEMEDFNKMSCPWIQGKPF